jgi:hypothetical protein
VLLSFRVRVEFVDRGACASRKRRSRFRGRTRKTGATTDNDHAKPRTAPNRTPRLHPGTSGTSGTKAPQQRRRMRRADRSDVGAPIYPSAVYLTSYDAGRGQRFYIFGSTVPYAELVAYYKTVLKQKGDELFEAPPTHQFETARFRDEAMAFAPSVTIKDYTYGGSAGYPNPKPDATPAAVSNHHPDRSTPR